MIHKKRMNKEADDNPNTSAPAAVPAATPAASATPAMLDKAKNPKRVEAGKKGAAARKAKREAAEAEAAKAAKAAKAEAAKAAKAEAAKGMIEPSEITKGEPTETVRKAPANDYKDYLIPAGFAVAAVAMGIYYFHKQPPIRQPATLPSAGIESVRDLVKREPVIKVDDPFAD